MALYSKEVNKATGIIKLIKYLNIPIPNTNCFGDGRNDIEMFEAVENSYAMGNAV